MTNTDRNPGRVRRWMGLALIAVMAFGAMAGGAAAHTSDEHGDITFHDSQDGEAQTSTASEAEPVQLKCEFWVRGHGMSHQNGTITASHNLGGPNAQTEDVGEWSGTSNESGGWDFEAGPFTLDENDRYLIRAGVGDEGQHATPAHDVEYEPCSDDGGEETPAQPPACPANLEAHAQQNEDIRLGWNASTNADTYNVYRATEDGDMQHVAQVNDTTFTDETTEAETTYTYEVTAANEAGEAEDCATAEVTAIPFFGHPALVAMAAVGSVGAVAAVRTRRG